MFVLPRFVLTVLTTEPRAVKVLTAKVHNTMVRTA